MLRSKSNSFIADFIMKTMVEDSPDLKLPKLSEKILILKQLDAGRIFEWRIN